MEKLKARWGIQSNTQLIIIFIVFGITGSSSIFVTTPILKFLSISKDSMNLVLYYFFKVIIVFPAYQILLVFFGFISGQFKFFWNFEKKMLSRLGLGFLFN
jgi:manganese efflux pump family protein